MTESTETPKDLPKATAAQVSARIRRMRRKHEEHTDMSINLYPMMDMMTILLVFLIKSFSASTSNVQQSSELQIPYSSSEVSPGEAIVIQVSRSRIIVEGRGVVTLRNGVVDPSQKQGGAQGFLVPALLRVMEQHRDRLKAIAAANPRRPFRGELQIIADRRTPFRTLSEILYTVGQAEFSKFRFILLKRGT